MAMPGISEISERDEGQRDDHGQTEFRRNFFLLSLEVEFIIYLCAKEVGRTEPASQTAATHLSNTRTGANSA
jgi:hypothetical protein